jgi:hypothetical protein
MSVLSALADGCQRVLRAPVLVVGLWLTLVVVPPPVGIDFSDSHLGLIEASAIDPVPALLTVLRDRGAWTYAVLATFLLGGFMDRLARNRATATFGFFGASGVYFFRFVRLGIVALPLYAVLLLWIYPQFPPRALVSYAALGLLVIVLNVLFDFARVRLVVEDRRSAIGALVASMRFVRRHAAAVLTLTIVNAALACGTWWLAATFSIGITAAVYVYFLARALLRLIFIASSVALFQRRLAHAGYVARPVATWPESPAADAILPQ